MTLVTQTRKELVEEVRRYYHEYHPAGYGTQFYTGGPGWEDRNYYYEDDIWGDNPLSNVKTNEDGLFVMNISRASHCD